jgi:hypothetical protein
LHQLRLGPGLLYSVGYRGSHRWILMIFCKLCLVKFYYRVSIIEMFADIRYPLADTRQRVRMPPSRWNPGGYPPIQEALGGPQAVRNKRKNRALTKNMVFAIF